MTDDPIVAEVRRVRDELSAKFNYDLDAIVRDIRERQDKLTREVVPEPKPQKPTSEE